MKRSTQIAGLAVALGLLGAGLWRSASWAPASPAPRAPPGPVVATRAGPALPSVSSVEETPPVRNAALSLPAPALSDEAALMDRLRRAKDAAPALAVDLAREGNRRFPDSDAAPERASLLIHALASLGRASEARGEAEDMVNRYPDSAWVREVERFTGAHRHRNLRLGDGGALESY